MLIDMLKSNHHFQLQPMEKQEIFARLANVFEDNDFALYLSHEELPIKMKTGNKQQWQEFLQLEPTKNYIKAQMAQQATVAQRKAFQSLTKEALLGNVQAARQINEISGIMDQTDNNRIIVLHQIKRPTIKEKINNE